MAIIERELSAEPTGKRRPNVDLATTKPGTPGGIFTRQFWHAIARSVDVPAGTAVPIRVMSEDYTLFRGAGGNVQLVAQRCPHRHALMHLGWVEGDEIRCVYHGWKFDCSGQCTDAPAEREGFAQNVRIKTYPTAEAYELIYGYFGPDEPPAFPPYPESQGEGVIEAWPVWGVVPCNYLQSFENSMDEVHVAFTHAPGGSHAKLSVDLPIVTAEETPWGMMRYGKRATGMVRNTLHYAPNIVRTVIPPQFGMDGVGGWPEITFHFTPIDDENHHWFVSAKTRVTGADVEPYWAKRREFYAKCEAAPDIQALVNDLWSGRAKYADVRHPVLARVQDIAVQAGQGRIEDRDDEQLGRSDAGLALWRRILGRELEIIAAGGTPKKWARPPDDVLPTLGA